jgi:hypothetical protein
VLLEWPVTANLQWTDETCAHLADTRAIRTRLDEVNGPELLIDDSEYGIIIRAVVEGTRAYLVRSGAGDEVVAAASEELLAHARHLYVAKWLREGLDVEEEFDRLVDSAS